eukprot:gene17119-23422_t
MIGTMTALRHLTLTHPVVPAVNECAFDPLPLTLCTALHSFAVHMEEMFVDPETTWRSDYLVEDWPFLTELELTGITQDMMPDLSKCKVLKKLTLTGHNKIKTLMPLDMCTLPTSLTSLKAQACALGCPTFHVRLSLLETLHLEKCHLKCAGQHWKVAVHGLCSLTSLELEHMTSGSMSNDIVGALSSLTALTNLAISSTSVDNLTLWGLSTLTGLHKLKWDAGGLLDMPIEPAMLSPFTRLCTLKITQRTKREMARWSNKIDFSDLLPSSCYVPPLF